MEERIGLERMYEKHQTQEKPFQSFKWVQKNHKCSLKQINENEH